MRVHLVAYIFVVSAGTLLVLLDLNEEARALLVFVVNASLGLALWRNRNDPVDVRSPGAA